MKGRKRLLAALGGEVIRPAPIWLMRQAGRYLPEYRALRAEAADFLSFCLTPELAVEASLQPVRRFGFDAAIVFSDILVLPWALGHPLSFEEGIGPVLPPLSEERQLRKLDLSRLAEAVEPVLQAIRGVRAALPPEVALIGFAGAPFTLACYLVDGRGGEFSACRRMAREEPLLFGALIECLTQAVIAYLLAQAEAGAEVLMLFDSWAGLVSGGLFQSHVVAPTAAIAAALKRQVPGIPLIGFPGRAGLLVEAYGRLCGLDCISLDSTADLRLAGRLFPERVVLQGNLDPYALFAGASALQEEVTAIAEATRGRAHVFNLGHGVLAGTPAERVAELVQIWRGQA